MIYEIFIVFSAYNCVFVNSRIDHFIDLLKGIVRDMDGQKFKFLCKLIDCEAQEGWKKTI